MGTSSISTHSGRNHCSCWVVVSCWYSLMSNSQASDLGTANSLITIPWFLHNFLVLSSNDMHAILISLFAFHNKKCLKEVISVLSLTAKVMQYNNAITQPKQCCSSWSFFYWYPLYNLHTTCSFISFIFSILLLYSSLPISIPVYATLNISFVHWKFCHPFF